MSLANSGLVAFFALAKGMSLPTLRMKEEMPPEGFAPGACREGAPAVCPQSTQLSDA